MKKLNLKNLLDGDDGKLISLLKTTMVQEPSKGFVESTLKKIVAHRTKYKNVYKPLKSPLYMMMVVGLILLAPIFLGNASQKPFADSGPIIDDFLRNISQQLDLSYIFSAMLLSLVLVCIIWMKLVPPRFHNFSS